jgi:hypothetical protein
LPLDDYHDLESAVWSLAQDQGRARRDCIGNGCVKVLCRCGVQSRHANGLLDLQLDNPVSESVCVKIAKSVTHAFIFSLY